MSKAILDADEILQPQRAEEENQDKRNPRAFLSK